MKAVGEASPCSMIAPRGALRVEAGDQVLVFQFQEQAGQSGLRGAHRLVERLAQAGKMVGGAQRESLAVVGGAAGVRHSR